MPTPEVPDDHRLTDYNQLFRTWLGETLEGQQQIIGEQIDPGGSLDIISELAKAEGTAKEVVYNAVINGTSAIFYVFDESFHMVGWNRRFEEVLKRSSNELGATTFMDHISPSVWHETLEKFSQMIRDNRFVSTEVPLFVSDGSSAPYLLSGNIVTVGQHWYIYGFGLDVEDLKATEHRAEHYAAFEYLLARMAGDLMALSPDTAEEGLSRAIEPVARFMQVDLFGICTFDLKNERVRLRSRWKQDYIGYTTGTIDGLPLGAFPDVYRTLQSLNLFIVDDVLALHGELQPVRDHIEPLGIRSMVLVPMADGDNAMGFLVLASAKPHAVDSADFTPLKTIGQLLANVLLRFEREMSLQEREAELEATLAAFGDGLLVLDDRKQVLLANHRFSEIFEIRDTVERGADFQTLYPVVKKWFSKEDFEAIRNYSGTNTSADTFDRTCSLMDGRQLDVHSDPYLRGGVPSGRVFIFRDVTEARSLQEQLRQSQKLESIGRLASGVAHDFNNILFGITSMCDVRLHKPDASDRDKRDLGAIKSAAQRAAGLTRQLMAFSRKQVLSIITTSLNQVVHDMSEIISRIIGENIIVQVELNAKRDTIRADPHQIGQVLLNLAVNARDAMPNGGFLLIETSNVREDDTLVRRLPLKEKENYILLRVVDGGIGMDDEIVSRIFDPFFTTKDVGQGTGLGLAMVYGIVKQHAGHVEVRSRINEGTVFDIYLPLESNQTAARKSNAPQKSPKAKGEIILLVEDEAIVRKATKKILQSNGYTVYTATNGEEALIKADEIDFDLLLTDVVMPLMGGEQLYDTLLKKRPNLPAVFMTGYAEEPISANDQDSSQPHLQISEHAQLLMKPVSSDTLLRTIRSVLPDEI